MTYTCRPANLQTTCSHSDASSSWPSTYRRNRTKYAHYGDETGAHFLLKTHVIDDSDQVNGEVQKFK